MDDPFNSPGICLLVGPQSHRMALRLCLLHPDQTSFKLNIATRRIEQLTNNAERNIRYEHLDWSPDGRKILFTMITDAVEGAKTDLCVMDIKRRHIRHILQPDSPMWIVHPNWSPDSEHIIYYYQGNREAGISIISSDGNNIVNITSQTIHTSRPPHLVTKTQPNRIHR